MLTYIDINLIGYVIVNLNFLSKMLQNRITRVFGIDMQV